MVAIMPYMVVMVTLLEINWNILNYNSIEELLIVLLILVIVVLLVLLILLVVVIDWINI